MFKYITLCFIVVLFATGALGQEKMDVATIKLNLDNQKNKVDTNTIKLQIRLLLLWFLFMIWLVTNQAVI